MERLSHLSGGQKQLKGGHQALVHSDQMVLVMAKQGGWTVVRQWPKTLNSKLNLNWNYQAQVHSGQMVVVVVS